MFQSYRISILLRNISYFRIFANATYSVIFCHDIEKTQPAGTRLKEHAAALNFPSDNTWLCIHLDGDFFKEVEKFDIVERGYQKFYAVPNDSRFVKKIWHLTNYIKKAVRKTKKNKYY